MNVKTEDTLSGFQEFFLQPIKDRSNMLIRISLPHYSLFHNEGLRPSLTLHDIIYERRERGDHVTYVC